MILDIKRAAKLHGMTLKEVASKVQSERGGGTGITFASLSQHINGNPSVKVLQGIAEAIGCRVTDLFFEEDDEAVGGVPTAKAVCPHCGKVLNIRID
jgi:transcriptional regulator with XRE-family HTH domain